MMPAMTTRSSLLLAVGVALGLRLALAVSAPITSDEGLHWMQGQHLAWGFRDHPPGTAVLDRLGGHLFADAALAIRLWPLLANALCAFIAYAILRETGGGRSAACAAGIATQLTPLFAFGFIMVPVVPHAPLVFAAELFLIRALRTGLLRNHLAWGLLFGAGMLTYYPTAVAALAVLPFLLAHDLGRRALAHWPFWMGAAAAAALFAPHLIWTLSSGRESAIHFQAAERFAGGGWILYPIVFLALLLIIAGPLLVPTLYRVLRSRHDGTAPEASTWRPLFATIIATSLVLLLVTSFLTLSGAHWAALALLNVPLLLFSPGEPPLAAGWLRAAVIYPCVLGLAVAVGSVIGLDRIWGAAASLTPWKRTDDRKLEQVFDPRATTSAIERWQERFEREGRQVSLATDRWSAAGIYSIYLPGHPYLHVFPVPALHGSDYKRWNERHPRAGDLLFVATRQRTLPFLKQHADAVDLLEECGALAATRLYLVTGFRPPATPVASAHASVRGAR